MISYIIWNGSPELLSIGSFSLRWYGLLFALGFLISQQILYYIYRKEGKPEKDVDTLTIYMVVATILGARLGHVIFYQPEIFWENPLGVLLPFEFDPFRFTGLMGLASHGGAFAILLALWLYGRKKKPGQSFLQVVDRIVILAALTGALIRLGNYFNSEIIGLPTNKSYGVVFVNRFTDAIEDRKLDDRKIVDNVEYRINDSLPVGANGRVPLNIYVFYKRGVPAVDAETFGNYTIKNYLSSANFAEYFDSSPQNTTIQTEQQADGTFATKVSTFGIARHPAQLYESISCVILFVFLFFLWNRYRENLPQGMLLGIFLIWCFGLRMVFELWKEPQVEFERDMALNMGQILSIPLVIAGIIILILSFRKKTVVNP